MQERDRQPSIRDVALLANVSRQTVSRVLNQAASVSEHTRDRVERAMKILKYRPNPAARALRSQRTGVVGVLIASNSLFVIEGLPRLEQYLRKAGYRVLITGTASTDRDEVGASLDLLSAADVDGLIVTANDRWTAQLVRSFSPGRPVVVVQPEIQPEDGISSVAIDLAAGVREVVAHLVEQGYRRLQHLAGPAEYVTSRIRVDAWTREIELRGLEKLPVLTGGQLHENGYQSGVDMLQGGVPEAVFTFNDAVALGLCRALTDAGLSVPGDVAIVGVDDMFGGAYVRPSLTTLRQPMGEMAQLAAAILLEAIAGAEPQVVSVAPQLIVRESSVRPSG